MVTATEVNFDGLIGPTHHYGGLAHGNLASHINAGMVSNPKKAALQGLQKMKFLHDMGVPQAVLPPHMRPHLATLYDLGFHGTEAAIIAQAARDAPDLLSHCYSASAMWVANAATLSPSADTADEKLHITPANLASALHRSIETSFTTKLLKTIFADPDYFYHHDPLPACASLGDEGAANHMRLARTHADAGLEIFVYGEHDTQRYRARQTKSASTSVARLHQLSAGRRVMLQQNPAAIDAGVFHNDVIAVSNEQVLFCHEDAYAQADAFEEMQRKYDGDLCLLSVSPHDLSLQEAVGTYLFNSQIVTLPQGGMAFIAPKECEENPRTKHIIEAVCQAENNPIRQVHYLDVRESMRNGGGPACLRLRVVMTERERAAMHQGVMLTEVLYSQLVAVVERYYRDRLSPADLADVALLHEALAAQEAVMKLLGLEVL